MALKLVAVCKKVQSAHTARPRSLGMRRTSAAGACPLQAILMLRLVFLILVPACALAQSRSASSRLVGPTLPHISDASAQFNSAQPTQKDGDGDQAKKDLDRCHVHEATTIPGRLEFARHFM